MFSYMYIENIISRISEQSMFYLFTLNASHTLMVKKPINIDNSLTFL
jgi:hypothetical protein